MSCCSDSAPIALAVCGDPVVGRALVLLLRGSGYDARFLSASSLSEPGSLGGVELLLLAPTPELRVEQREVLLASLGDTLGTAGIPILKLVSPSEGIQKAEVRNESEQVVFWPCSTEELEQRIEAILLANPKGDQTTCQGPGT